VRTGEPVTLGKTHLAYMLVVLFVVLPGITFLAVGDAVRGFWCERFELPEYGRALGFRVERRAWGVIGGDRQALAITWVDPGGILGQAGVRAGDVPRAYHGVGDLCLAFRSVSAGEPAHLEVTNLGDQPHGQRVWRLVTIPAMRQ